MANTPTITKAQRVLEFIGTNPDGRTLKEIQTFILVMNGASKWLNKGYLKQSDAPGNFLGFERTHAGRGYWCDFLYGTSYYAWSQVGFLNTHCVQLPSGRWKLTEPVVGPFRGKETKSLQFNKDRWSGARKRYIESLPQCPSCQHALNKNDERSPDKAACITHFSGAYNVDCSGRVWWKETTNYREKRMKLCKLSKNEVLMAAEMVRSLHKDYEQQVHALWKMLGGNLA